MVAINRRLFLHSLIGASCLLSPRRVVSASKRKVVVIGGGVGGLSAVWVLAKDYPNIDVTIIEPNSTYTTCFSSSAYLAEFKNKAELNFLYQTVKKLENVKLLQASADQIDVDKSAVRLSTGDSVPYDRLIVSPGISFQFDAIDGYSKAAMSVFPQAYDLGASISLLKERLEAVDDGALIIISSPDRPYRCSPAPYERASMIAHYLKSHKPKSKILIVFFQHGIGFMEGWLNGSQLNLVVGFHLLMLRMDHLMLMGKRFFQRLLILSRRSAPAILLNVQD